ncbi:MAG: hypothetical protein EB078_03855 [Proteobacteria bacterium]|nr:hypothetical protein [Pseudomonadota bacterium]NDD04018.1 hypothetical protein [Pseudomonadota bacterium]
MSQKDKAIFNLDDLVSMLDPAHLSAEQNELIERFSIGDRLESVTNDIMMLLTPKPFKEGDAVIRDGHITQWNSDDHEIIFRNGAWMTVEGYPVKSYQLVTREEIIKHITDLKKDPGMTDEEKTKYITNIQDWCEMVGISLTEVH